MRRFSYEAAPGINSYHLQGHRGGSGNSASADFAAHGLFIR